MNHEITEEEINSAQSLVEIEDLIAKCNRCSLHKTKICDVPGAGNQNTEVVFIGEAPGKAEDEQGEPFVGAAGKFLTEMLEQIGLERKDIVIANVLKHRPPNNRDPLPDEAAACWPFLRRQIEIINPLLIVFLGRHAMNRYFSDLKISEVHGKAFRSQSWGKEHVFLALYHPAAALYNGGMRQTLKDDFNKIPEIIKKIKINN